MKPILPVSISDSKYYQIVITHNKVKEAAQIGIKISLHLQQEMEMLKLN